ncbi:DUF3040 domain-containing protein [Actinophytocola sp.]|uniref:DUF3040 domain-containing protein n=1 Tax=Actinophytocola sp. TaxID=1872138 RepID=UPI00389AB0F0
MLRDRSPRVRRPDGPPLTPAERRCFRRVERGLWATDPRWYALHCPLRHRRRRRARCAAAVLSLVLVLLGALTGVMPIVLCGVVMAFAAVTGHISARTRRGHTRPPAGGRHDFPPSG